jgi:hypothetical protein
MKNAVLYMFFLYLLAPNAFCTKAFSQLKSADEGSQQPTSDSVDSKTAGEDAPAGEGQAEQQPADDSADAEATNADKPEGEPSEAPKPEAAETTESATEIIAPAPSTSASQPAVPQSIDYETASLVSSPTSPRPSSGTGLIIAGSIITGIGGLNLLAIPLCYVIFDDSSYDEAVEYVYSQYEGDYVIRESTVDDTKETARDICVIGSLAFGGVHVAVGLPLLIVGLNQRSDYNEWREKNPEWAGFDLRIGKHNAIASWKTAF